MADEKETKKEEEFEDLGSKKDPKGGGSPTVKRGNWLRKQLPTEPQGPID